MSEINPLTGLEGTPQNKNLRDMSSFFNPEPSNVPSVQPNIGVSKSKYNDLLPMEAFFDPNVLETTRAQNQPFHHEMGRSLLRMGAEIVGGTLAGAGYIAELAQGNALAVDSENLLIQLGEGLKDYTNEQLPIHNQNPGGFMFGSSENFWEGFISLGSTIAMMIPSYGVAKGVGLLGQGIKGLGTAAKAATAGSKVMSKGAQFLNKLTSLTRSQKYVRNGVISAITSRNIESNMEAAELYKSLLDQGYDKKEALDRARDLYIRNWVMLAQDIPQYLALGKVFSARAGKFVDDAAKAAVKPNAFATYVKQAISEGGEEAYQYIASQIEENEAAYNKTGKYTTLGEILSDATIDPQFWNSVVMGAMGGAVFQAIGSNLDLYGKKKKAQGIVDTFVNERGKAFADLGLQLQSEEAVNNPELQERIKELWNLNRTLESLLTDDGSGNAFAKHIEFLESLENLDETALGELREKGYELDPETISKTIPQLKEDAYEIQKTFDKFLNKAENVKHALDLTKNRFEKRTILRRQEAITQKLEELKKQIPGIDTLTENGKKRFNIGAAIEFNKNLRREFEKAGAKELVDSVDSAIAELEKELKEIPSEGPAVDKKNAETIKRIKKDPAIYQEYETKSKFNAYNKARLELLDLEYTKLWDEGYRQEKNLKDVRKRIGQLADTDLEGINAIEKELSEAGMLGDSAIDQAIADRKKSIEETLRVALGSIATKELNNTPLNFKEKELSNKYEDIYDEEFAKRKAELAKKDPEQQPEEALDPSEELNGEGEQPQPVQESKVKWGQDLYPMIINPSKGTGTLSEEVLDNDRRFKEWLASPIDKTQFKAVFSKTPDGGIEFTIIDAAGEAVLREGKPLKAFLFKAGTMNITKGYALQVHEINKRLEKGETVVLNIKNQLRLSITTPEKGNVKENSIIEVFGDNIEFAYTDGNGNYKSAKTKTSTSMGKAFVSTKEQKGLIFAVVKDNTGQKTPIKLNQKKLSKEDILYITRIIEEYVKNKKSREDFVSMDLQEDFPYSNELVGEMTYDNLINFFVYSNTNSASADGQKGLPQTFYLLDNGIVKYGREFTVVNEKSFSPADLMDFFTNVKNRYNILIDKLGDPAYLEHLVSNGILTTDKEPGGIFVEVGSQKGEGYIYFDPILPAEAGPKGNAYDDISKEEFDEYVNTGKVSLKRAKAFAKKTKQQKQFTTRELDMLSNATVEYEGKVIKLSDAINKILIAEQQTPTQEGMQSVDDVFGESIPATGKAFTSATYNEGIPNEDGSFKVYSNKVKPKSYIKFNTDGTFEVLLNDDGSIDGMFIFSFNDFLAPLFNTIGDRSNQFAKVIKPGKYELLAGNKVRVIEKGVIAFAENEELLEIVTEDYNKGLEFNAPSNPPPAEVSEPEEFTSVDSIFGNTSENVPQEDTTMKKEVEENITKKSADNSPAGIKSSNEFTTDDLGNLDDLDLNQDLNDDLQDNKFC